MFLCFLYLNLLSLDLDIPLVYVEHINPLVFKMEIICDTSNVLTSLALNLAIFYQIFPNNKGMEYCFDVF